jgi:hypothetical protein
MELLVLAAVIGLFNSDPVVEFVKEGNGNPVYKFAYVKACETGKRDSGFALAPTGSVVLKQVNRDGTIGDVCKR